MIRLSALVLASTALMGTAQPAPVPTQVPIAAVGVPEASTAPKPEYGTFGFDTAGMDKAVAPGDNFYGFADGAWAKNTPIPADKSNYGAFNVLDDLSHVRTQEILEAAKSDPNSKIGIAYAAYLDTAAINSKSLAPITPWLDRIRGLKSRAGYAALLAKADRNGVDSPLGSYVAQDDKDPDSYVMNLVQSGLGMPDRDYYLSPDAKLAAVKTAYEKHIAAMLKLAGEPNAATRARAIVNFETQIAKVSWTKVQNRDSEKTYNKMSIATLSKPASLASVENDARQPCTL